MNSSNREKAVFRYLLNKSMDEQITSSEVRELNALLETYPDLEGYYIDNVLLQFLLPEAQIATDSDLDIVSLIKLAEYEKIAPAIQISEEEPSHELIQKVVYPTCERRNISKQIFALVASVAAILLFFFFVNLMPSKSFSLDVATIVDQIDTQWLPSNVALENGERLWTNQGQLKLKEGIVKLRYDDGVDVVIEGPAAFEIDRSRIFFDYGKVYCHVSKDGLGFVVKTPTAQFIDLGTEFGVQMQMNGSSEVHVIKGKVQLFADSSKDAKIGRLILEDEAIRYNSNSGQIDDMPIKKNAFVRQVDSKSKTIWRGESHIDLADIISVGNGFGKPIVGCGYHPITGAFTNKVNIYEYYDQQREQRNYKEVRNNQFVDGVFLPDGGWGPVQINSAGDVTEVIPATDGFYHFEIANGPAEDKGGVLKQEEFYRQELQLDGIAYGTQGESGLYMHANCGITFNLNKMREATQTKLLEFVSVCGIPDQVKKLSPRRDVLAINVYVFLDDRLCFEKIDMDAKDPAIPIRIPIEQSDRFLTIAVVASGGEPPNHWCVFGKPVVVVEN